MANWFSVFQRDPKRMPGQGLASPDYDAPAVKDQYNQLLGLYETGLQEHGRGINTQRLASLDTLLSGSADQAGASKMYLDAIRLADPESARLLDMLTESATSELQLDNELDPNQNRLVEQAVRAGGAARGMGYGPADVWEETFAKTGYGDQLRDKRRQQALTIQQLRQALAARPADVAMTATLSQSPEQNMWNTLGGVYQANQQNARTKAGLETQIGMHQADTWNNWFKVAAAAI